MILKYLEATTLSIQLTVALMGIWAVRPVKPTLGDLAGCQAGPGGQARWYVLCQATPYCEATGPLRVAGAFVSVTIHWKRLLPWAVYRDFGS